MLTLGVDGMRGLTCEPATNGCKKKPYVKCPRKKCLLQDIEFDRRNEYNITASVINIPQ